MKFKLSIFVVFFLTGSVFGQESARKPVGKVLDVEGRAYRQDGRIRTTLPAGRQDIPLFATQEIGCISRCKITFKIGSTLFTKSSRYIIPNQIRSHSSETTFEVAGGRKGGADIFLFPIGSDLGFVRPESFEFRWRVVKIKNEVVDIQPLTLSLTDCEGGEKIWHGSGIDYKSGSYSPRGVISELKNRQLKDSSSKIELTFGSANFDKKQQFCFSLISISSEQKLQSDLAVWNEYDDFIRLTERANVFAQYRLFEDAVFEYEEALRVFPKTDHLLSYAMKAYLRVGDTDNALELLERLRRISSRNREYLRMREILRRISRIPTQQRGLVSQPLVPDVLVELETGVPKPLARRSSPAH